MTSPRSLIRLALKKGINVDFRIIDFVSIHVECHAIKSNIKEELNKMIDNEEIIFNKVSKKLKLQGYPINKDEGKTFVSQVR